MVENLRSFVGANSYRKRTYMYNFYFEEIFGQFFCKVLSNKFPIKLLNDPRCSINIFYKGKLQSLTKKEISQWLKKNLAHFDHYSLINEKKSTIQIW